MTEERLLTSVKPLTVSRSQMHLGLQSDTYLTQSTPYSAVSKGNSFGQIDSELDLNLIKKGSAVQLRTHLTRK